MLKVDKRKWEVHDPDKVLSYERDVFDINIINFFGEIGPREDLMAFTHKETNYIVDFGYYGSEVELDGYWIVYVIDTNMDEPWESPIERHDSKSFLDGIGNVHAMLEKYT